MKKIVLLSTALIAIALVTAETEKESIARIHHECQEEPIAKLSEKSLAKLRKHEIPDDPIVYLHSLCMTKKMGLQDANGKPVENKIRELLAVRIKDEAKLNAAVKECAVDKGTPEDTSAHVWLCTVKHRRAQTV